MYILQLDNKENTGKTFRFETVVENNANPLHKNKTSYVRILEVYYLGKNSYQILTIDSYFSHEDNSQGQLIKKISDLFDDIKLQTDAENSIIKITNTTELKLRWKEISSQIFQTNRGTELENYFKAIDNLLDNTEELISFFGSYKMFGMLFNGHVGEYEDYTKKQRTIYLESFEAIETLTFQNKTEEIIIKTNGINEDRYASKGIFTYRNNNIVEGFVGENKDNYHLKHSLLWIG